MVAILALAATLLASAFRCRWRQLCQIDCIGLLPRSPALAQAICRFHAMQDGPVLVVVTR
jgi:hypothetical protein